MKKNEKPENALYNILFNIIIPVFILNKASKVVGPAWALIIALLFPIAYGAYDLIKRKKTNFISILGLLNISITGSLALSGLTGIWFAVKEAAFPTIIGLFVFASSFTKKPFIESIFLNPSTIDIEKLEQKLIENNSNVEFHQHLKTATKLLSGSFAVSAILNFVLAKNIFTDIDPLLGKASQSDILNQQIASMTSWSFLVIMAPSMIILLGIFWYLFHGIKKHTGLSVEDLMAKK